jgi:hypothetical protein
MASIRCRTNGYSVLWREAGSQRSQMFPTRREAEAFKARLRRGTADTSRDATRAAMPFGRFVLEQYLPNARLSDNTRRDTAYVLSSQLSALRDRPLSWVASHRAEVQDIISQHPRRPRPADSLLLSIQFSRSRCLNRSPRPTFTTGRPHTRQ